MRRDGSTDTLGRPLRQCVGRGTRLAEGKRDCLVLDFVDLSDLALCSLPSLFGAPRELDLAGNDAREAARAWQQILFDHPGFELEAGALTLAEIQDRAASFDPLALRADAEVRAISGNAWFSLGRHGVGLHFARGNGKKSEALVLKRGGRGKPWEIVVDRDVVDRVARLEDAVAAVDYEIEQMGRNVAASARPDAEWRQGPAPSALVLTLTGPLPRATWEAALRLATWERIVGAAPRR